MRVRIPRIYLWEEVNVHLYEEQGIACLKNLLEMFAFAIYDRNQRILYLARDYFGIKPIFYTKTDVQEQDVSTKEKDTSEQ